MADLCYKLLDSDISETIITSPTLAFARVVNVRCGESKQLSEKVVECLREANRRLPDLHRASSALAESLFNRLT